MTNHYQGDHNQITFLLKNKNSAFERCFSMVYVEESKP